MRLPYAVALLLTGLPACDAARPALRLVPFDLSDVRLDPASALGGAQSRTLDYVVALNESSLVCQYTAAANLTRCVRGRCPMPGTPTGPECEPLPGQMGRGAYFGHFAGHFLSACAMLYASTGDMGVHAKGGRVVRELVRVERAWAARSPALRGYCFPFEPSVWDQLFDGRGSEPAYSVPLYTLHKVLQGLLDQHAHLGDEDALALARRIADWVVFRVDGVLRTGGQRLWQRVLGVEWGGMNEALYELHTRTSDSTYLHVANLFNHWQFTVPLAVGVDDLDGSHGNHGGSHANTHIPEVVGTAAGYEVTGNRTQRAIAESFFAVLTQHHSFATGGSSDHEAWGPPDSLGSQLNAGTEESCTQYNVLKLARRLLGWSADARLADFYERALLNGIVGNQLWRQATDGPGSSGAYGHDELAYIYMLPLGGGGVRKPWGRADEGFPCCWGTLTESLSKLGDTIFAHAPDNSVVFVNLFVGARLVWRARGGLVIEQTAGFPESEGHTTTIVVREVPGPGVRFALGLRVPGWLTPTALTRSSLAVNGKPVPLSAKAPGTYAYVDRVWIDGDRVDASFAMPLTAERIADDRDEYAGTVAFLYGPLVLAGLTTSTSLVPLPSATAQAGSGAETAAGLQPERFIRRTSPDRLEFAAHATVDGVRQTVPFRPLFQIGEERYTVYFNTTDPNAAHEALRRSDFPSAAL